LALEAERERIAATLPEDGAALWSWCLNAGQTELLDVLAVAVAFGIDAVERKSDPNRGGKEHGNALAAALSLNMAEWYRPTAAGYFGRIGKVAIISDLEAMRQSVWGLWPFRGVGRGGVGPPLFFVCAPGLRPAPQPAPVSAQDDFFLNSASNPASRNVTGTTSNHAMQEAVLVAIDFATRHSTRNSMPQTIHTARLTESPNPTPSPIKARSNADA
jgi:hypothetical protein